MPLPDSTTDRGGTVEQVEEQLDPQDRARIGDRLDFEIAAVRAVEPRADTKAGSLLSLCATLLVADLALLGSGKVPGPGAAGGWFAATLLGLAVVLLSAAARPNLDTETGFVRWARMPTGQDVLTAVATDPDDDITRRARQLRWLSRSLHSKFGRIRTAQTLLVAALAIAGCAAALTALSR